MKNPLYAYRSFEKQFRQAAKEEIEKQYIGYEHAAFRDLLAFLRRNSSTIGRWRLALISGLIKAEELARLIRKLLMAFPTANLEKAAPATLRCTSSSGTCSRCWRTTCRPMLKPLQRAALRGRCG